MTEHDETLERVIEALKEPVTLDPALDARVMKAVASMPRAEAESASWLSRNWTIRMTPLRALAAAAAIAVVILATSFLLRDQRPLPVAETITQRAGGQVMQFVLVAPGARSVTLVGDFNDWNLGATQLARQPGDGVWWVAITLPPGRYRYAFIVDGSTWRNDPYAPGAEDEFGRPNSVVTIGGA